MPWAPVNGIDLYYEVHGSGPHLLFAHGQGGNHLSWWQQVPFFAPHYTCITYDNRAFGLSRDTNDLSRHGFAADVIGLLDHLGVTDVRVVAHSMGGRSALPVALRATDRCRALILAGTNAGVTSEAIKAQQHTASEARNGRGLGAFSVAEGYREQNPQLDFLLREISRLNPPRPANFLHTPAPNGRTPQGNVAERLTATGIPVLFVVGEHDQIVPPAVLKLCHSLIPGSRYEVIAGSGHSAYFEKPEVFNTLVLNFLRSVDSGSAATK